jgi:hypothetical protein
MSKGECSILTLLSATDIDVKHESFSTDTAFHTHLCSTAGGWGFMLQNPTSAFMTRLEGLAIQVRLSGYSPSPSEHLPSPSGYLPSPSGYLPSPSGYLPSPSGYLPSPSGYLPSPSGYLPSPSGYLPSPSGHLPSPSGYLPSPSGYLLTVCPEHYAFAFRRCNSWHILFLMHASCIYQGNFDQPIQLVYASITEFFNRIICCFLLVTTADGFADFISEGVSCVSCVQVITELPCWEISDIHLQLQQNIMRRHDFQALKTRYCRRCLAHKYRCRIYGLFIAHTCWKLSKLLSHLHILFQHHSKTPAPFRNMLTKPSPSVVVESAGNINSASKLKKFYGGHKARIFSYDVLEPYITTSQNVLNPKTRYLYVDHINDASLNHYPQENFVHTQIPLEVLFPLLTLSQARKIAIQHNVHAGSRCTLEMLLAQTVNHSCLACNHKFSVFQIEKGADELAALRNKKKRTEKKKTGVLSTENTACSSKLHHKNATNADKNNISFPPDPVDNELCSKIIAGAVKKMDAKNIEEAGCAVCGLLKPSKELSRLKNVKNFLHVLERKGLTRIERKSDATKVREYPGPVLDYSCSRICDGCRMSVRKGKVPRLALAKGLWLGKVPDELKSLRFVEKLLIARVRHTCCYVKVASGMRKMKANVIAFQSPIPKVYDVLPPPRSEMNDVLAILFTGPCKPVESDLKRTPFLVRRNYVARALEWLRLNHSDYANIKISEKNLNEYPENEIPVSIEYRPSITNKVSEGTSVFDMEPEDGTDTGECSFTVHGLTGDMLDTMSTNTIKAMALRHLNNEGKILAVGHSENFESMWDNPQLYPQMFPWLFPYGIGGIGATELSDKEHKKWLLMYHDKRFQTDINFPFVAFSHSQMKQSSTQSYLLVDQSRFQHITERLLNLDQNVLADITVKLADGEFFRPESEAEKACFQVIKDLDHVAGKVKGSTTSKKYMRNEIWSLIAFCGAPSWYITLSPADIQHPICIYYADTKEEFKPNFLSYDERIRMVCKNPVAGARFFHFIVETFITDVLGVDSAHCGLYGDTKAFYGTVEQQGRLTLHLHMLLWIIGSLNPQEMRQRVMQSDSEWNCKIINWLESCHSGEFMTGTQDQIANEIAENTKQKDYADPTQTLPLSPPRLCTIDHNAEDITQERNKANCKSCSNWSKWWYSVKKTIDDLLFKSNVHNCSRNVNKDGSRKKSASSGCKDNKWGKCKARFPRSLFQSTTIDALTGAINVKKLEPWLNTFTPIVTYLFRCNTDVTSLSSGTAIKAVVIYVSDYITKSSLKTHTIFDSITSVFHKNSEMIGGTLPMKEKARRVMMKVVNLLSAKMEMGAPMICMYLLDNPDHYTDHTFVPFYWQSFVTEARSYFVDSSSGESESRKVTLIKRNGRIFGLSPVFDYIYRSPDLENITLYEWIAQYKRIKIPKSKSNKNKNADDEVVEPLLDISFQSDLTNNTVLNENQFQDNYDDEDTPESFKSLSKNLYMYTSSHPLYSTHASKYNPNHAKIVPNFIGASLPRCDQGDREYYCSTMLTFFKPWRSGKDLKALNKTWDEEFNCHDFNSCQIQLMKNFNIRYECLDARDDYRAQMKKGVDPLFLGSWENTDEALESTENLTNNLDIEFDDNPQDMQNIGNAQILRMKSIAEINQILNATGWSKEISNINDPVHKFQPTRILSGSDWNAEVLKKRQEILDKRNENNTASKRNNSLPSSLLKKEDINTVKIIDKSYLEKDFDGGVHQAAITETVDQFNLNSEQNRAFHIIANHAVSQSNDHLKMYLGGMGGTGKSQVLKALSHFFNVQNESHRFIIVAPTGSAAALLGGSTYHYMFGINDYRKSSSMSQIKTRLMGVEYVFLDEVSMLSARDMYRISNQLSCVLNVHDQPFGGMNMVFAGDFAQLPPAMGGENISLYGRFIGAIASDKKSQEEAIGKALWHQVTTVVILRQNMRQQEQSEDDCKFRTALENMRYKSCTLEDIIFLQSRISSKLPNRPSVTDKNFRNVSIITAKNIHKDEINRIGALRFAQDTGQILTDFYSDDSPKIKENETDKKRSKCKILRIKEISTEMQEILWNQLPSTTDKHIAGKLSLCIGLPVMIRHNFATELCITKGQEGYVYGWQSSTGSLNQRILDTLFIRLENPPSPVKFEGLPENVVPIAASTKILKAALLKDNAVYISRTQVEILVNFSMTDFGSQGKTRPYNVVDLNNLLTHQSYYTALSRSATADGTIILQGFDPRKITGNASGALRQEFRELELLDEITALNYNKKLHATVVGESRNILIKAFRKWKGEKYIPKNVHKAIRWSKHDPLNESEIYDYTWKDKNKTSKTADPTMPPPVMCSKKRKFDKMDSETEKLDKMDNITETDDEVPVSKKICLNQTVATNRHQPWIPRGILWDQNSCGYDVALTILYSIWINDTEKWSESFRKLDNRCLNALIVGFEQMKNHDISFEETRDKFRYFLETFNRRYFLYPNLIF